MHVALTMPAPERKERHAALVEKVFRTTAHAYCERFVEALGKVKAQSVPRASNNATASSRTPRSGR